MGLSCEFLDAHIGEWEQKLKGPAYPYREKWPRHLFHHAPLENAVSILKVGQLLSRSDSDRVRTRDVAAVGVINHSVRAHQFARLYFRPRTPTQFHIEGIRKLGECRYGENAHAPVLIMFVFDARCILSLEGVYFSDSNMQTGAIENSTAAFFQTIPFDKVYHEGGFAGDQSITSHRCAEVLAPSPMMLAGKLRWIYCRSEAERVTLIQSLEDQAEKWEKKIRVSDDLKVFDKRFTFVERVLLANDGIIFRLNPRYDLQTIAVLLEARDTNHNLCIQMKNGVLAATPPNGSFWRARAKLKPGAYRIIIELDGHRAYDAVLRLDETPF